MKKYDLIVIGSGGALKILKDALAKKKKVAVIEKDYLGGTCLNRGCIPSKMMIHPAYLAEHIEEAKKFGIKTQKIGQTQFKALTERIYQTVHKDTLGIAKRYKAHPQIDYYKKKATFVSNKVVKVGQEEITADNIVIAVGARPRIAPIPGLEGTPFLDSTKALFADKLPKKMIVIGGGYIAVELGNAYAALGCEVHFLVKGKMIGREDGEVIQEFERVFMEKRNVHKEVSTDKVEYKNKQFTTFYTDNTGKKKRISSDALFVATGIMSNADTLKLENTGVTVNKRGFIEVNNYLETKVKGIYAMGDCIGRNLFRHAANWEGEYLGHEFFVKKKTEKAKPIKYPPMPHAIFTSPQVAGVGLTEEEAIEKKLPYLAVKHKYINSAMGMAFMSDHGFVKLIVHKKTRKILGAHIIGPEASNMIHLFIAYMTMNKQVDEINKMIFIHPAIQEIARNAVRTAIKKLG